MEGVLLFGMEASPPQGGLSAGWRASGLAVFAFGVLYPRWFIGFTDTTMILCCTQTRGVPSVPWPAGRVMPEEELLSQQGGTVYGRR